MLACPITEYGNCGIIDMYIMGNVNVGVVYTGSLFFYSCVHQEFLTSKPCLACILSCRLSGYIIHIITCAIAKL